MSEEKEQKKNDTPIGIASVEDISNELSKRHLQFFLVVNHLDGSLKQATFNSYMIYDDHEKLIGAIEFAKAQMIESVITDAYCDDEDDDEDDDE